MTKHIESKLYKYAKRATTISEESHDSQTKVAALLISKDSGAVVADGFNGFVRGAPDTALPNSGEEKYKFMQHAELNLICNAIRHGISTSNCVIYCTLSPCTSCMRMLWQAGIDTIYFSKSYKDLDSSLNMGDIRVTISDVGGFKKMKLERMT